MATSNEMKKEIGDRIKHLIIEKDIKTNKRLSEMVGIPLGQENIVSDWINGKRSPTFEQLLILSDVLEVSVDFLLGKGEALMDGEMITGNGRKYCGECWCVNINNLRKEYAQSIGKSKVSNDEFGKFLNISTTSVFNYCEGVKEPSLSNIIKIAQAFNVSLDWLVGNSNVEPEHHKINEIEAEVIEWDVSANDMVNHPSHYNDGKIEVIDYIEDKKLDFNLGNVIKYVSRAGKKDPAKTIEDLQKARFYLDRAIDMKRRGEYYET